MIRENTVYMEARAYAQGEQNLVSQLKEKMVNALQGLLVLAAFLVVSNLVMKAKGTGRTRRCFARLLNSRYTQ